MASAPMLCILRSLAEISVIVLNAPKEEKTYGLSKISKLWDKYKQAAPYIFAFYRLLSSDLERMKSVEQFVDFLEKLTANQRRLARVLGRAAYAADVLGERARNVRLRDFRRITRVRPPLRPFGEEELAIIESIDRNAPIP